MCHNHWMHDVLHFLYFAGYCSFPLNLNGITDISYKQIAPKIVFIFIATKLACKWWNGI